LGYQNPIKRPHKNYVNVCRLMIYLEQSIKKGTTWTVFETNTEATWTKIESDKRNFLMQTWRNGMLMGASQQEAYFVKCDWTTMTQNDLNNGKINVLVGVAPVKPAEFIILRISQIAKLKNLK
jgi:phage tail sheath protein FI